MNKVCGAIDWVDDEGGLVGDDGLACDIGLFPYKSVMGVKGLEARGDEAFDGLIGFGNNIYG